MSLLIWDLQCRAKDLWTAAKTGSKDAPVIKET